jgi:hypothetical protein
MFSPVSIHEDGAQCARSRSAFLMRACVHAWESGSETSIAPECKVPRSKWFLMASSVSEFAVKPSDSVREAHNQDGAVLLDVHQGECFSINPVGVKIWTLLKQQYSLDQIAKSLASEFALPEEDLYQDVAEFVGSLKAQRLVVSNDATVEPGSAAAGANGNIGQVKWWRRLIAWSTRS